MKVFLAKTDPDTYSIEDFEKEKVTLWDGVHNYQAINVIKSWSIGDIVLIYQSIKNPKLIGISKVVTNPCLNELDSRHSFAAKLQLEFVFSENFQTTLKEIKAANLFNDFALIKQSRLSVMNCPESFVNWLIVNNIEFAEFISKLV